jgi:hypothetical protein
MSGRDHSCPDCGRGGFNDPVGVCGCPTPSERDRYIERAAERLVEAWKQAGKDWLANRSEEQQDYATAPWIGVPERWLAEAALSEVLDENARLRDELREIADCPRRGVKAESTDGQAWNDRAWVIERARAALSPGGGADPTRVGVSGGVPSEAAPELERGGGAERPEEET